MVKTGFRSRALTALLMLVSFVLLASSGLILFFAPRGRIANATGWDLLGLNRWQWEDLHACFALLMLAAAVPHIWMNRKPLLGHLRQKVAVVTAWTLPVRLEVLAAAALCVFVLVGTVWQVPPVSYVSQLRSEVRGGHQSEPLHFAGGRRGWRHVE